MKKRTIFRLFFVAEIIIFGYFYYFGAQGIRAVQELNVENEQISKKITVLNEEISSIKEQIVAWNEDPFHKEKIAREQLQMAAEGEEIYVI